MTQPSALLRRLAGTSLFLLALAVAPAALAQGPGSGGPEPGNPTNPTEVPIDGGASLLLAAGGAYALSRLRARKQAE